MNIPLCYRIYLIRQEKQNHGLTVGWQASPLFPHVILLYKAHYGDCSLPNPCCNYA